MINEEELIEMWHYGCKIVNRKIPMRDAQDVYQDVAIRLISYRDRYEGRCSRTTWAGILASRQVADYYRKRSRDCSVLVDEVPETATSPWDAVDERLDLDAILATLPEIYRETLSMAALGMTPSDIAKALGISFDAACSRYKRAITYSREWIKVKRQAEVG